MPPVSKKMDIGNIKKTGNNLSKIKTGRTASSSLEKSGGKTKISFGTSSQNQDRNRKDIDKKSGNFFTPSTGSSSAPKSHKKTTFGIIWIPTRRNKYKQDKVYNPHNDKGVRMRAPSMYPFMSGDTPDPQFKKKDETTELLGHSHTIPPLPPSLLTDTLEGGIKTSDENDEMSKRPEFIRHNQDETKEAAGDSIDQPREIDKDYNKEGYFEQNDNAKAKTQKDCGKEELVDKVDSVFLRPPPPEKARSAASTTDEEDCAIKCLYYTLQCCDCVII